MYLNKHDISFHEILHLSSFPMFFISGKMAFGQYTYRSWFWEELVLVFELYAHMQDIETMIQKVMLLTRLPKPIVLAGKLGPMQLPKLLYALALKLYYWFVSLIIGNNILTYHVCVTKSYICDLGGLHTTEPKPEACLNILSLTWKISFWCDFCCHLLPPVATCQNKHYVIVIVTVACSLPDAWAFRRNSQ